MVGAVSGPDAGRAGVVHRPLPRPQTRPHLQQLLLNRLQSTSSLVTTVTLFCYQAQLAISTALKQHILGWPGCWLGCWPGCWWRWCWRASAAQPPPASSVYCWLACRLLLWGHDIQYYSLLSTHYLFHSWPRVLVSAGSLSLLWPASVSGATPATPGGTWAGTRSGWRSGVCWAPPSACWTSWPHTPGYSYCQFCAFCANMKSTHS